MRPTTYIISCSRARTARRASVLGTALLVLAGCPAGKSTSSSSDAGDSPDAAVGCTHDPRGETYLPSLKHAGKAGLLGFELVQSDPAPPGKGNNTWTLQLSDASGKAVTGATLEVTPYMPDHGHGTSVMAKVSESASGYMITPLYLFMGGIWQVTIRATAGGRSDSTVFSFCIDS